MDNKLFDHLVLSLKEAGAIKHDEIPASRIIDSRLPGYKAIPEKNEVTTNTVLGHLHVHTKTLKS
jgi:putative transcriptional regulator